MRVEVSGQAHENGFATKRELHDAAVRNAKKAAMTEVRHALEKMRDVREGKIGFEFLEKKPLESVYILDGQRLGTDKKGLYSVSVRAEVVYVLKKQAGNDKSEVFEHPSLAPTQSEGSLTPDFHEERVSQKTTQALSPYGPTPLLLAGTEDKLETLQETRQGVRQVYKQFSRLLRQKHNAEQFGEEQPQKNFITIQ